MKPKLAFSLLMKHSLANQPVIITDSKNSYSLGLHLEILEDKTKSLTFEDIQKPECSNKFIWSKVKVPNYVFSSSAFWFRFDLESRIDNNEEFLLELDWPLYDKLELYIRQEENIIVKNLVILCLLIKKISTTENFYLSQIFLGQQCDFIKEGTTMKVVPLKKVCKKDSLNFNLCH